MPTPTRTAIAVAISFVLLAVYGACTTAVAYSMYGPLLDMPAASTVGILAIVLGGIGFVHLAWTWWSPSRSLCLAVLFVAVVCCSVLLGVAVEALPAASRAIELAPYLTSYQNIMERFFASDDARQYNYSDSLAGYNRPSTLPSSPRLSSYDDKYPSYTARTFAQAYCLSEGYRFCSALPLTTTILYPGIWSNPNTTAEIARTLSTLPATLANVTVTATTTIESLCADARVQIMTSTRDQTNALYRDLYDLCHGCATLRKIASKTSKLDALKVWIHDTCPMTAPQPSGVFCVATAQCLERDLQYAERDSDVLCYSAWPMTYLNPSYDKCFGTTLMTTVRTYVVAIAAASGVVSLLCLVLFAHVWKEGRTRVNEGAEDVQTPMESA